MNAATVGLVVRVKALPGKEDEVESLLVGGLSLVLEEPGITAWFVVSLGPGSFGIFDVFGGEQARDEHLHGKLAAALMERVGTKIEQPSIEHVDVLAAVISPRLAPPPSD